MKLNVPFIQQTSSVNCAPSALRMVLAYFDKDPGIEIIEKISGVRDGKSTFTIQLGIVAAKRGYKTKFYSKDVLFNEEHMKKEVYQKFADMTLDRSKDLLAEAKKIGVEVNQKHISLSALLKFVSVDSLPIVLVDWNIVKGLKGEQYQGHFVVVIGYDEKFVYVHNHDFREPQPNLAIPRKVFDEARKADGTDEDILVVYRNKI